MTSCDLLGHYLKKNMLSRNVPYIDAYTTWDLSEDFHSKRRFRRHENLEYRKLVSPIKITGWILRDFPFRNDPR